MPEEGRKIIKFPRTVEPAEASTVGSMMLYWRKFLLGSFSIAALNLIGIVGLPLQMQYLD
jgi:hypothetical protein